MKARNGPGSGPGSVRSRITAATPPPTPTKNWHDVFMHIAEGRVNSILAKLNTLSKLASGKSKYGYTDADVELIRATLMKGVNESCDRLRRKPVKGGFKFVRREDAPSA